MPQLSLYIDKETLSKIEAAAKINHISISKWVSERLRESLANHWPNQYETLFGSIGDPSFSEEVVRNEVPDLRREVL